jgi:dihydroflavonol-4-reductase
MISKNSAILVTGGTGLVGGQILKNLTSSGWTNIRAIKRNTSAIPTGLADGITWIQGDILDVTFVFDIVEKIDVIIHAAADVGFSLRRRDSIIKTSQNGTAHLVDAALNSDVKKFVFVSSIAAIGRKKQNEVIDELQIFSHSEFDTSYGLAKFLAEQEVWRGQAEGLTVAVINPAMIIGPGDFSRSSLGIFNRIYKQELSYFPTGTNGWVDVRDVADAAIKCVSEHIENERFIISSESLPYGDVFALIAKELKVPFLSKPLGYWTGQLGWRLQAVKSWWTGKDPIITRETVRSTSVNAIYNNQKSISKLEMSYLPIEQSVRDASQAYLKR